MFVKVLTGAFLASALGVGAALAQSAADVGGPRELPPAGFSGQQFIDSRGCVFLRAGLGGTVNWVPRVDRNRKAMCGYPPTFGGGTRPAATVAADPAPAPAPKPVPAVKPAPVRVADEPAPETYTPAPVRNVAVAPVVTAAPVALPQRTVAVEPSFSGNKIGCTRSAPVPQRLKLTNGGTVVVCTRGDGTLEGLRAPVYPAGSRVGASLSGPDLAPVSRGGAVVPLGQAAAVAGGASGVRLVDQGVQVPPGYEPAWKDDRLNPLRGVGTVAGQVAQDQVWTRDVPARLTTDPPKGFFAFLKPQPRQRVVVSTKSVEAEPPRVTVSTKSRPAADGRVFVQVGSFGVPANADGAVARLSALGLPVARSQGAIGGKAVQVVLAGPFGSAGEAQAALGAARGAGFGDAFIR